MNFGDIVRTLARTARADDVQAAIRHQYGKGATRWVAAEAGISPRTARRWMSDSPPRSRIPVLVGLLAANNVAAQRLRTARSISAGTVAVSYDDLDQGSRSIGDLDVDDAMADELAMAADALDEGDLAAAADAFSDAVIMGYSDGLQETLTVSEYDEGTYLA